MSNPLQSHWKATKRILRKLASTLDFCIEYQSSVQLSISGFVYANWVSYVDTRRSTSSLTICLGANPILWSSRK